MLYQKKKVQTRNQVKQIMTGVQPLLLKKITHI